MMLLHRLAYRLRRLARRRQAEAEMTEEMRFHLEHRAADYASDGLGEKEARYAAQRKFGNVGSLQERVREAHGWRGMERAFKDVRCAFRQLAKSPGFTVLAIITLGLGIGANTTMFSVLNSILLKPLPYADSAMLERIDRATAQNPEGRVSPADWLELRREMKGFGEVLAYTVADTSLSDPGQPAELAQAMRASANFFSTLGVRPQHGRDFLPREEVAGNDRVVILSQRCWQNRFEGRGDIIGRALRVDGELHEIVGVLPAAFNDWRHLGAIDLFRPLALDAQKSADRHSLTLRLIGRRSTRLSRAEAERFIANFGARLAADHPEVNAGATWRTIALNDTVLDKSGRTILPMLIGLSGFVLLIACSNLANLLLARTMARAREFAVRSALGASRLQLLRPLLAEALLLALAGGVLAVVVALWAADYLAVRSTGDNGERVVFAIDWRVLSWALGASLVTALTFGLAPALFALRLNLNDTLKNGGRGMTGGRGHRHFRHGLIVGQFALAMVLLSGAGLFIRGLAELNERRAGWESDQLVVGNIALPKASYPDAERIAAFHRLALERLESLPGVASASISAFTPFFDWPDVRRYLVEGPVLPKPGHEPEALVNAVSPRYFETVGTRRLAGRMFTARDTAAAPRVFIINQAMAVALFGEGNPIGRRLAQAGRTPGEWGEIVGVVASVQPITPESGPVTFQVYQPMEQEPRARNAIAVRVAGPAAPALIDSIRTAMTELDGDLPVRGLQPADLTVRRANYDLGVLRDMLAAFAVLGLGLASLGIYGVVARTMAQRASEFATRLALGACIRDLSRLVLFSGVRLALIGAALGLIGAVGIARLIAVSFPGMRFEGPPVLIGVTVLLVVVALGASWLPARRASKMDAMGALRAE